MVPKRIGILIPSTNTSVEADFQRLLSDAVTVHSERLYIPDGTMTEASLDLMNRDLQEKAALLATARIDVIAYACTSGSFYRGASWDEQVRDSIEQRTGVPCVTTSTAVSRAFRALDVHAISVMTPYPDWTNRKLAAYYAAQGLDVKAVHGDARAAADGHRAINDQDPAQIAKFALDHFDRDAQALFCSCTAWRSLECVQTLEASLKVPVVTSNQATIWATLHTIGSLDKARPAGRLFSVQPAQ
ncbi:aspartate/glutamate racemase family protein [Bordetella sp. BOR01]|uniref:maleate cis-trans isomerase family protein n=1 Tax=Bordetella sp. BOR01 TaxID=2854779 RepID=UPI001C48A4B5|nr:aspartate/glutamate racemase family protein [Bordetella sp. BOR01]MBV7483818.1 aspartate/glutamate racemase family protein [Bordetella sp. BOR01]